MNLWQWIDGRPVSTSVPGRFDFDDSFDVLVAGLGSAGSIALITAARRGLSVIGLEKLTVMGGSGTAGGISSYYRGIPGGLFEEIDKHGREIAEKDFVPVGSFHPEARHLALETAATEAGARIAYESRIIGVFMEARQVCGVQWISPAGVHNSACRILIDATGDGEVCAMAGCEFSFGRDFDSAPQPWSHVPCWILENRHCASNFDASATLDVTDGRAFSEAVVAGWLLHLRERYDESRKLLFAGRLPGQREGRLIKGEMTIRLADCLEGKMVGDPVAYEFANFDTHSQDWAFESDIMQEWLTVAGLWGQDLGIPIPLKAMIPMERAGLLAIGRCLSVDHDVAQAVRMQRAMQQCGEAAATAAALALKKGCVDVAEVPYSELAAELRKTGCLPETPPPMLMDFLLKSAAEIRAGLASDKPGRAIWSARLAGAEIQAQLRDWLDDNDSMLACHSALALGLLGDTRALPVLRRIIRDRDAFIPQSSRSHNAPRLWAAIYLAGRLGDSEVVPDLVALLKTEGLAFDVFSYALMALLRIGRAVPEVRKEAADGIRAVLENENFRMELPLHRNSRPEPSESYFRMAAAREFETWEIDNRLMERIKPLDLTLRERALYKKWRETPGYGRGPVGVPYGP